MIRVERFKDEGSWLEAVAADFAPLLEEGTELALCLAGGSTPEPAYRRMARALAQSESSARLFVGDERCVPLHDRERNELMITQAWAVALDAGAASLQGWGPCDRKAMETALAELWKERSRRGLRLFDRCWLGLGSDGHTAGIFAGGAILADALMGFEDEGPWTLASRAPVAPVERVSLGYRALRSSESTRFLVRSRGKEEALARLLASDPSCPAVHAEGPETLVFVLEC